MKISKALSIACIILFILNCMGISYAQTSSKLAVKSIGASDTSVHVGDTITIEVSIQNIRTITVTGISVDVKVFETSYGNTLIGTSSINDLPGGSSGSAQFTWKVEKAGTWHIKAVAKINGIYETESNLSDSPEIKATSKPKESGIDVGTIIMLVGGIVAVVIVVVLIIFLIKQKKKREEEERKKREMQKVHVPPPVSGPTTAVPKDYWEWKRERDAILKPVGMSSDGTTVLGISKKKVDTSTFEQPGEVYPCPKCGTHRENAFAHCPRCIATDAYDAAKNKVEEIKSQGFDVSPALEKLNKAEQLILSKKYIEAKKYSKDAEKIAGQIRDGTLQVPKPEEVHKCNSCGNEVEPDWLTCPFCETPLKSKQSTTQPTTSSPPTTQYTPISQKDLEPQKGIICRKCQNRVERDWTSCPFCGESLDPSAQSKINVEQSIVVGVGVVKNEDLKPKKPKIHAQDAANCPNCKAVVKSNWTSCPSCGFVLEQKCPDCGQPLELGKECKYCEAKSVVMAAEQKLIDAKDLGIDLTQAEIEIAKARDNLKAYNFEAAKSHAKAAENAIKSARPSAVQQYPAQVPQQYPTQVPQQYPAQLPQQHPAQLPQQYPAQVPQQYPTQVPQQYPTQVPQQYPTQVPQQYPTQVPQQYPTQVPQQYPTQVPQQYPTQVPQQYPTQAIPKKQTKACMTCGFQTTDVFVTVCPMCRSKM